MDIAMISQRVYYFKSDKEAEQGSLAAASNLSAPLLAASFLLLAPQAGEAFLFTDDSRALELSLIPSCEVTQKTSHGVHMFGIMLGWGAALCYLGS